MSQLLNTVGGYFGAGLFQGRDRTQDRSAEEPHAIERLNRLLRTGEGDAADVDTGEASVVQPSIVGEETPVGSLASPGSIADAPGDPEEGAMDEADAVDGDDAVDSDEDEPRTLSADAGGESMTGSIIGQPGEQPPPEAVSADAPFEAGETTVSLFEERAPEARTTNGSGPAPLVDGGGWQPGSETSADQTGPAGSGLFLMPEQPAADDLVADPPSDRPESTPLAEVAGLEPASPVASPSHDQVESTTDETANADPAWADAPAPTSVVADLSGAIAEAQERTARELKAAVQRIREDAAHRQDEALARAAQEADEQLQRTREELEARHAAALGDAEAVATQAREQAFEEARIVARAECAKVRDELERQHAADLERAREIVLQSFESLTASILEG